MTIWPPSPETIERPAYRWLARRLTAAIEAGELAPGDRLPTHRDLAWKLGLSVQTVSRAYEELTRAGVIAGEVGRGTFVRGARGDTLPPYHRLERDDDVIDCSMLMPVLGDIHREALSAALTGMAAGPMPPVMTSFRPREALRPHVEAALGWLERCGIRTRADHVIPTNGSTAAMTVALMTAAAPGDLVVSEALGQHTLHGLTRALGLRLAGLPVDDEGIRPEAFWRACELGRVRVLFTLPSGAGPMACTMSAERREELVAMARRHDVTIVEDDAWGPLEPGRPPPLAALAPERTFYFTSLTKCLLPGLRIGWLIPPAGDSSARGRHLVTNWMATPLAAELATTWLSDGTALRLLRWQRLALARRNATARRLLDGLPVRSNPRGLHVWLDLPERWEEALFVAQARQNGVAVASGAAFANGDQVAPRGVRICLGAAKEQALAVGLQRLASLWRSRPEPQYLTI